MLLTTACLADLGTYERADWPDDDHDGDGQSEAEGDCDDRDATVFVGASDACGDGVDQDCSGSDADGATDADGDGVVSAACTGGLDCDDDDAEVHPGADERCDERDDDCDGEVDEDAPDAPLWYADVDGDGLGDPDAAVAACTAPDGTVANGDDCDDTDALVLGPTTYYGDADGDGYGREVTGDTGFTADSCQDLTRIGLADNGLDCDDDHTAINPETTWFADADGDDWGDPFDTTVGCEPGAGWALHPYDCDDDDASLGPQCAWLDLSMSDYQGCAIRGTGLLACWGNDRDGAIAARTDVAFAHIDLGDQPNANIAANCGILLTDGTIDCWGDETAAAIDGEAPGGNDWVEISVGVSHACARDGDGRLACWGACGADDGCVTDTPVDDGYQQVIAKWNLTVALDATGHLAHWGNGFDFPALVPSDELPAACDGADLYTEACDAAVLAEAFGDDTFTAIAAEHQRVCGLRTDGELVCAGAEDALDAGGHRELAGLSIAAFDVGYHRTCAIEAGTGAMVCAGDADAYVASDTTDFYYGLSASMGGFTDCALTAGAADAGPFSIECWGRNDEGEGDPPLTSPCRYAADCEGGEACDTGTGRCD